MPVQSSTQNDLFNLDLIRSYVDKELNPRFVERHWLKQQVEDKLADPDCRFLLLTAEPGAGKSAFMAWLAYQHPDWCRYFIRRDQRTPLGDPGAHSFLLQVGFQLAATYPNAFNQEQLKISVAQRIGKAQDSEIVGAEIGKLVVSPFYKKVVEIQQEVNSSENSTVAGIRIGELYGDSRSAPLTDFQFMALFDPASTLLKQNSKQQIVVLVDALDELRYRDPELSLLRWLADCPELPANLRFVLTSRKDDALLNHFRGAQQSRIQELKIEEEDPEVTKDLTQYAYQLVETEPKVQEALAQIERDTVAFARQAVEKANGNFGYLDAIGRAVDQAVQQEQDELLQEVLNLSQLPNNLQELYAFFLGRIKDSVVTESIEIPGATPFAKKSYLPAWEGLYQPILGILAVAREPLRVKQIANFAESPVKERWLQGALERLGQFLDQGDGHYRLYHTTLPEFLTSPETQTTYSDYYLDPSEWHTKIAAYYRGEFPNWEDVDWDNEKKVDDYGLRHLTTHLYNVVQIVSTHEDVEQIKTYSEELYGLICKPLMEAKFSRFGSHQAFSEDVKLSIATAQSETPSNLVQEVRGSLLYSTLGSFATDVPPEILGAMTSMGQVSKAKSYASLILDPEKQSRAYQQIGEALLAQAKVEEARKLILTALTITEGIEYNRSTRLNELLPALAQLAESDRLLAAARTIKDEHDLGELLSKFVPLLTQLEHFDQALVIAQAIPRNWIKGKAFSTLAQALAEAEDKQRLNTLLENIETRPADWLETSLLSAMAEAFTQIRDQTGLDRILSIVDKLTEAVQQDTEVRSLAKVLTVVKDPVRLNHLLEAVKRIENEFLQVNALNEIANAQFEIEDQDGLNNLLRTVEEWGSQLSNSRGLSGIAYVFSNLGNQDALYRLLTAIEKIESEYSKAEAIKGLIEAMANTKNKEGLCHVLKLAKAGALSTVPENLVKSLALVLAKQGELDQALDLLEDIEDGWSKGLVLEAVALKMLEGGEVEQALQLLDRLERQHFEARERVKMRVIALTLIQQDKFDHALDVIESTNSSNNWDWESTLKSTSVESLAQAFAEKRNKDGLCRLVAVVKKISSRYKEYGHNHSREYSLRGIAIAFAQMGEFEQALATVNEIESEGYYAATDSKEDALCKIVSFLADVGDKNRLKKILAMLETLRFPGKLHDSLVYAFAKVHEFEQALILAERSDADAFIYIAQRMIQAGRKTDINQVLARTKMITDEYERAKARTGISQALAQSGELDLALQATVGVGEEEAKAEARSCITHGFAQVGKFEYAIPVLESIQQEGIKSRALIQMIPLLAKDTNKTTLDQLLIVVKTLNKYYRVEVLNILLPEIVQLDYKNGLNQAVEVVQQMIEAKYDRFDVFSAIAQALVNQGDQSSFNQALELAEMVEDLQPALLAKIAPGLTNTKDKSVLYKALLKIEGMQDEIHKTEILACVAQGFAQVGDKAGLNQISEMIDTLDEKRHKEVVISKIAAALAQMNEIDQAFSTAEMIEDDDYLKAKTLGEIANILAKIGQAEEAITIVATIDIPDVLSGLAKTFAQVGDEERMMQMLDAWAKTVQDPTFLVEEFFQEIAPILAQVGKVDLSIGAVNYILISKPKSETLVAVAQVLASSNNLDGLNELLELAREITEGEHRTTALAELVQCFAQISKIEQSLSIANEIKSEWSKTSCLSEAALKLAQSGNKSGVEQIFMAVQLIDKKYLDTNSLSRIAQALTLVGLNEDAFLVWRNQLAAQLVGRNAVFKVLAASAPFLSVYDKGETLWSLYRTVQELESWWTTQ